MTVDQQNFHSNTKALFEYQSHDLDELVQLFGSPNHTSEAGSLYWYLKEGVVRWSDHWGKVKNCMWRMSKPMKHHYYTVAKSEGFIGGFCLFENFTIMP